MTARRGSLRFRVGRVAGERRVQVKERLQSPKLVRAATLAGRWALAVAVLVVVFAFGAQAWRMGYDNYQLHRQIVAVRDRNGSLAAQTVRLKREIILSRNPEYLVPLIHEQLGLTKPNEIFIQVAPLPAPQH